jgi:hypothetical protein
MGLKLLLMKPGTATASVSSTYISTTSTYLSSNESASAAGVLFLDLDVQSETMEPLSKKTQVTRFANRGSVHVDLREISKEMVFKDIYLGNILTATSFTTNQRMIYEYVFSEWPKTSTGKILPILWDVTAEASITNAFSTYYRTAFVDWTGVFKGTLVKSMDIYGNCFIKQLELEEKI